MIKSIILNIILFIIGILLKENQSFLNYLGIEVRKEEKRINYLIRLCGTLLQVLAVIALLIQLFKLEELVYHTVERVF